ncbi:HAD family hydrolase [Solimonas sp. K1W22B-7]|uniref:HAD family hydrolase n=1 Tax=Solimonas sp. K1W22B-7 TaxID=2303331 RepID=UPI000E32D6DB|nr:HAD-IA family hydrolase [Solimonas sp. K1W22B-7]AXQ29131.1 HAD family hydrolase [Solimonas sp. K1W22B-7]
MSAAAAAGVRPQLLIFDWDGTLADSAAAIVQTMQVAIRALSLPTRDDKTIRELIGLGMNDVLTRLFPELELDALKALLERYRAQWVTETAEAPLFPGALEALEALHGQGYRLAVATGKSRRGLDRSLRHHAEIRCLLVGSRTADETASKPDPLMLRELLEAEDLKADQALMIGDTEYDMAMAAAIGMPCAGVLCGVHDAARLRLFSPAVLLEDVSGLPAWLTASTAAEAMLSANGRK